MNTGRNQPGRARAAFTLVELLVVIGIVAVILSIALPALGASAQSAQRLKSLSNVRQLATAIFLYAEGSDGMFPATEEGRLYPAADGVWASYPYWQVNRTWSGVITNELPYEANVDIYLSPRSPRRDVVGARWPSSYMYSTSFVGDPGLWVDGAAADGSLERAQRVASVRYPSQKGLLWDLELAFLGRPLKAEGEDLNERTPMAMGDGSAANHNPERATDPVPNPFTHALSEARIHNTPRGVLGRDY